MKPIVILGNGPMTAKLIDEVDSSDQPWCVAGVVDQEKPDASYGVPWLGPIEQLAEIVEHSGPSLA